MSESMCRTGFGRAQGVADEWPPRQPTGGWLLVALHPSGLPLDRLRCVAAQAGQPIEVACPVRFADYAHTVRHADCRVGVINFELLERFERSDVQALHALPHVTHWMLGWHDAPADWFEWVVATAARGTLAWTQPDVLLERALATVESGDVWFPRSATSLFYDALLGHLVSDQLSAAVEDAKAHLSPREQQALDLMHHGLTNKQMARELGVSPNTIKKHLARLFRKMGIHSRRQVTV